VAASRHTDTPHKNNPTRHNPDRLNGKQSQPKVFVIMVNDGSLRCRLCTRLAIRG